MLWLRAFAETFFTTNRFCSLAPHSKMRAKKPDKFSTVVHPHDRLALIVDNEPGGKIFNKYQCRDALWH